MDALIYILGLMALVGIIIWLLPFIIPLLLVIVIVIIAFVLYIRHKLMKQMDDDPITYIFEEEQDQDEDIVDDSIIDVDYVEHVEEEDSKRYYD